MYVGATSQEADIPCRSERVRYSDHKNCISLEFTRDKSDTGVATEVSNVTQGGAALMVGSRNKPSLALLFGASVMAY